MRRFVFSLMLFLAVFALFTACSGPPRPSDDYSLHCTLYIDCKTILDNLSMLDEDKLELIPEDGVILDTVSVGFENGESVYDILVRELRASNIQLEASFVPLYNSAYVEGIGNIYEFDCGYSSGWEYSVNGEFPGFGCSAYYPKDGDVIRFLYTCSLGSDIGDEN